MKKIAALILLTLSLLCLGSCSYESEPPKTGSSSSVYPLPQGELPTPEERAESNAAKQEYQEFLKQ